MKFIFASGLEVHSCFWQHHMSLFAVPGPTTFRFERVFHPKCTTLIQKVTTSCARRTFWIPEMKVAVSRHSASWELDKMDGYEQCDGRNSPSCEPTEARATTTVADQTLQT